jgi:hypothetical protein
MLSYLVTSRVRRQLLDSLWSRGAQGSVTELARRSRVSFAAAYNELEGMRAAGLALSERRGNRVLYRANEQEPRAHLLRQLLADARTYRTASEERSSTDRVRSALVAAGAPLGAAPLEDTAPELEETVVEGVALAHEDATVARVMPVVVWRQRQRLDLDKLVALATRRNERQATGYFLELTGRLGGDQRLTATAKRLRDKRRSRLQMFFVGPRGPMAVKTARSKTTPLARSWGFLMNMDHNSFASAFAKHAMS